MGLSPSQLPDMDVANKTEPEIRQELRELVAIASYGAVQYSRYASSTERVSKFLRHPRLKELTLLQLMEIALETPSSRAMIFEVLSICFSSDWESVSQQTRKAVQSWLLAVECSSNNEARHLAEFADCMRFSSKSQEVMAALISQLPHSNFLVKEFWLLSRIASPFNPTGVDYLMKKKDAVLDIAMKQLSHPTVQPAALQLIRSVDLNPMERDKVLSIVSNRVDKPVLEYFSHLLNLGRIDKSRDCIDRILELSVAQLQTPLAAEVIDLLIEIVHNVRAYKRIYSIDLEYTEKVSNYVPLILGYLRGIAGLLNTHKDDAIKRTRKCLSSVIDEDSELGSVRSLIAQELKTQDDSDMPYSCVLLQCLCCSLDEGVVHSAFSRRSKSLAHYLTSPYSLSRVILFIIKSLELLHRHHPTIFDQLHFMEPMREFLLHSSVWISTPHLKAIDSFAGKISQDLVLFSNCMKITQDNMSSKLFESFKAEKAARSLLRALPQENVEVIFPCLNRLMEYLKIWHSWTSSTKREIALYLIRKVPPSHLTKNFLSSMKQSCLQEHEFKTTEEIKEEARVGFFTTEMLTPVEFHYDKLPAVVKGQVKTLLAMALFNENGNPRHPEAPFWVLPREIMAEILNFTVVAERRSTLGLGLPLTSSMSSRVLYEIWNLEAEKAANKTKKRKSKAQSKRPTKKAKTE